MYKETKKNETKQPGNKLIIFIKNMNSGIIKIMK